MTKTIPIFTREDLADAETLSRATGMLRATLTRYESGARRCMEKRPQDHIYFEGMIQGLNDALREVNTFLGAVLAEEKE